MKIITFNDSLAIPLNKIQYVQLKENTIIICFSGSSICIECNNEEARVYYERLVKELSEV